MFYDKIDEQDYHKELDKDISYDLNDEKWISLLAFKESLSKLKDNLDNNISSVFIFDVDNEKKMNIFKTLLEKYSCKVVYLF